MALSYNASSTGKNFFQRLSTTAARVSAATFDSAILPGAQVTYTDLTLGNAGSRWVNINDKIFFDTTGFGDNDVYFKTDDGGGVGIGTTEPTFPLHVVGESYFNGTTTIVQDLILTKEIKIGTESVNCDDAHRGYIRFVQGGTNDELQICMNFEGSPAWRTPSTTITSN